MFKAINVISAVHTVFIDNIKGKIDPVSEALLLLLLTTHYSLFIPL